MYVIYMFAIHKVYISFYIHLIDYNTFFSHYIFQSLKDETKEEIIDVWILKLDILIEIHTYVCIIDSRVNITFD